jgi:hypothetical protein
MILYRNKGYNEFDDKDFILQSPQRSYCQVALYLLLNFCKIMCVRHVCSQIILFILVQIHYFY